MIRCDTPDCYGLITEAAQARGATVCRDCAEIDAALAQMPILAESAPWLFTYDRVWQTGGWCMVLGHAFDHMGRPDGRYTMMSEEDEILVCLYDSENEDEEGAVLYEGSDVLAALRAFFSGEPADSYDPVATANVDDELSSCCKAPVSYYGDGGLYCKACYGSVEWEAR